LGQFTKNYRTFYPKISFLKYGFGIWDPGSGKNLFRLPDPGVKKASDPGSASATLLAILSRRKNYRNARKDGEQTKAKKTGNATKILNRPEKYKQKEKLRK
jgi:hypothetical protein